MFICGTYIPPQNSPFMAKTDYFNDLVTTTNQFMKQGNVILAGDMNARIGNDITHDPTDIPGLEDIVPSFTNSTPLVTRSACDVTKNQHGKKLLDICNNLNLHVANGRTPGDLLGNFTCFTNNGASTVDLVIADDNTMHRVVELKVLPPEFMSVHAPISIKLKCSFETSKHTSESFFPRL